MTEIVYLPASDSRISENRIPVDDSILRLLDNNRTPSLDQVTLGLGTPPLSILMIKEEPPVADIMLLPLFKTLNEGFTRTSLNFDILQQFIFG